MWMAAAKVSPTACADEIGALARAHIEMRGGMCLTRGAKTKRPCYRSTGQSPEEMRVLSAAPDAGRHVICKQ